MLGMTTPPPSATTPIGDLLRQIAHRTAPAERAPLLHVGEITLPDAPPQTLPLPPELAVAWRALLGGVGLPWQAEALAAVRRGTGIALVAPPPLGAMTLLLLVAHHLSGENPGTMLLIAPDEALLADLTATARNIDALLGGGLPNLAINATTRPPRNPTGLILLTAETLHRRVLRLHNRGWAGLWPKLNAVVLPAVDQAAGTALGHTRWLLRRLTRLRPLARPLTVYASLSPLADVDATLAKIVDVLPPIVLANTSRVPLTWALWRGGDQPLETAIEVAVALRGAGLSVHLQASDPLERALLARRGADQGLTIASGANTPAHSLVVLGNLDAATLPALAISGYRAVVLIADDTVAAQVAIRQPALLTPNSPLPLPIATNNAYVNSAHVRCAAEERPLHGSEIADWEATSLVERLQKRGVLAQLPGIESWQPVALANADRDTYEALHPATTSDAPVPIHDEKGIVLAYVDPLHGERRLFPGAVVRGGRVVGWNDDGGITVRVQSGGRTMAERRTSVTVREQQAQRSLDGGRADVPLRAGRVVVAEEIVARRGITHEGDVRRVPFDPPLHAQWSAPAVWIAAANAPANLGEMLVGVLPLLVRCGADELVPCVADDTLYLVEAQPGGRGIIDEIYGLFEAMLHLAGLAARALLDDPLLGTAARSDLAWMETILMPLSGIGKPSSDEGMPTAKPNVERRTRASMVATPSEVAARRRSRGNTFAVPRSLPRQGAASEKPTIPEPKPSEPPLPIQPFALPKPRSSTPAQPMRLDSQPPVLPRAPLPARPATRNEAPAPPKTPLPKLSTPRPAQRRSAESKRGIEDRGSGVRNQESGIGNREVGIRGQGSGVRDRQSAPTPDPRPPTPVSPPTFRPAPPPEPRSPTTAPARREPPPLERPPFQSKQRSGVRDRGSGIRNQESGIRNQESARNRDSASSNRGADSTQNRERNQPPNRPPTTDHRPPIETSSDPDALLAKARRLREQREAEMRRNPPPSRPVAPSNRPNSAKDTPDEVVASRFAPGDRIFCVPYGEGVVQKTRVRDGRELLLVNFAEMGDLRVDPIVNAVRLLEPNEVEPENED